MKMFKSRQRGFTIFETLVVVIILGIIAAFGLPQYSRVLANTKLQNKITEWREAFYYAQREAIRLKHNVVLCPSDDGEKCNGTDFKNGWIVLDVTENQDPNTKGKLLRDYPPSAASQKFSITLNPSGDIRFLNNGRPSGLNARNLSVVYTISNTQKVESTFKISPSGRIIAGELKKPTNEEKDDSGEE